MKRTYFFLTTTFLLPLSSYAQDGGGTGPTGGGGAPQISFSLQNPFRVDGNLFDLAQAIVNNVVLPIGGTLCVLAFIYAGFMYVTAQGNPTQIGKAHYALLFAAIGTAVLLGSWMIADVIGTTVNNLIS